VSRDKAAFEMRTQLAGYEADVDASVNLSKWPAFGLQGGFPKDLVADVTELVKTALDGKAKAALDAAKDAIKDAKVEVAKKREEADEQRDAARKTARKEADAKLDDLVSFLRKKENEGGLGTNAWKAARIAASAVKLRPDGNFDGLGGLKSKLDDLADFVKKAKGRVASDLKAELNRARSKVDAVVGAAKAIPAKIEATPAVQTAQAAVDDAQKKLSSGYKNVFGSKIDPAAAYATQILDSFTIDQIGFDSGLSELCGGKLPELNVTGTFAGKQFDLRKAPQLAAKNDLRARNRDKLEKLAADLFKLVDRKAADDFANAMVK